MMAALNQQAGQRKWGEIAELFPDRTRKATEAHGTKLLKKMFGGSEMAADTSAIPVTLPWTDEEDQKLYHILRNMANDATVSEYLYQFPGRSELDLQLRADYLVQRHNDASMDDYDPKDTSMEKGKTSLWTVEEDDLLEQLVQVLPEGPGKWEHVVQHFPHRTRRGTISHAKRLMAKRNIIPVPPTPKATVKENAAGKEGGEGDKEVDENLFKIKTLWTFLEEERLLKLINESELPRKWDEIATNFPGRSRRAVECHGLKLLRDIAKETRRQQQAAEGPKTAQSPTRNYWSQEEEERLLIAMEQIQGAKRWYEIAKLYPERSKQAVETHGINLLKYIREKSATMEAEGLISLGGVGSSQGRLMSNTISAMTAGREHNSDSEDENGFNAPRGADGLITLGGGGELTASLEELLNTYRKVKSVVPSRSKAWSIQDDEMLRMAMTQVNGNHWSKVAQMVPNKTAQQCLSRWRTLNPSTSHDPWTEDVSVTIALIFSVFLFNSNFCIYFFCRRMKRFVQLSLNTPSMAK